MIFYIADTHFGDERIFNLCSRPFQDLAEYQKVLCCRWNKKVNSTDTVYVLGDIANEDFESLSAILNKLNGHKHLIVGNHDEKIIKTISKSKIFETMGFIKLINDNGRQVCLCHYPLLDWVGFNQSGFHIYGHIHNKTVRQGQVYAQIKEYYKDKRAYNAGVDVVGFEPVTLDEIIKLKEKNINEPYIN